MHECLAALHFSPEIAVCLPFAFNQHGGRAVILDPAQYNHRNNESRRGHYRRKLGYVR
jgi:hypothetical protein